jgi:hypothetical protein
MRIIIAALAVVGLMGGGCAMQKTYETVLNVCSSGNGTVKSASVLKSSGDAAIDKHAVEKVASAVVYQETEQLSCKPLTVEYKVAGETA